MNLDGIDREKNDRDINIARLKGSNLINDIKKREMQAVKHLTTSKATEHIHVNVNFMY